MSATPDPLYELFHDIFHLWYEPLCKFAYSFLKDESASEDIVQEVFMRIWKNRQDVIATEGVRYYLFAAVRNNCISKLRRDGQGLTKVLEEDDAVDFIRDHDEQETDHISLVASAIEGLPPACQRVFLLSKISKLSHKEIGELLGISVKTVENQVGKALRMIRAYMKEKGAWMIWAIPILVNFFLWMHGG